MKWNGRTYRPANAQYITKKKPFDFQEALKPYGEKELPAWSPIVAVNNEVSSTPIPDVTPTPTPSNTPTGTPNPTTTQTGTPNPTPTQTPTGTAAVTPTPTNTGTAAVTPTPTQTGTASVTPTPTNTPTASPIPFSPSGLTGLQIWNISTSGASVSSWTNYGLLGGVANQGTAFYQPTLTNSSLGSYSGQTFVFSSQDYMINSFASTSFSALTSFAVYRMTSTGTQYGVEFGPVGLQVYNTGGGGTAQVRTSHNPSAILLSVANSNTISFRPTLFMSSGDTASYDAIWQAGSFGTFTGTKIGNGDTTTFTQHQYGINNGSGGSGYAEIFEFILYNRKLTPSELTQVENYLKTKYQYSTW